MTIFSRAVYELYRAEDNKAEWLALVVPINIWKPGMSDEADLHNTTVYGQVCLSIQRDLDKHMIRLPSLHNLWAFHVASRAYEALPPDWIWGLTWDGNKDSEVLFSNIKMLDYTISGMKVLDMTAFGHLIHKVPMHLVVNQHPDSVWFSIVADGAIRINPLRIIKKMEEIIN